MRKLVRRMLSTLLTLAIFLMGFPACVGHAADPIAVYGGGGGGGGNGGMPANGGTSSYGVASGGTGGGGLDGYAGGSTGGPTGYASTGTGGGGGGSGGGYLPAGTNGANGESSNDGLANGGAGGGNGAAAGTGNGFTGAGTGINGGSGGAGGVGNAANEISADSAPDSIMVQAGSGGNGGNTTGGMNPSAAGGDGGAGGSGGAANLTLAAPTVTVSGSVVVESGSNGSDGQIISWSASYGTPGSGGTGGAASLQCTGALSAPSITVTKHDGTVDVDIGTVDATANTTITANGTAASDFVIGIINVASGTTLTIDNSNGELTIGAINIASGGNVIISTPIPGIIVPPTFSGETSMTLTQGYAATSTGAYTITGNPAPTVTKTSGNAAITWDDTAKKLNIADGLTAGIYPVELTVSNGVLPNATLTFTLTVTGDAPTISGETDMTLTQGYAATSTGAYTITGNPAPTVTKTSGNAAITWDDTAKKLNIAAGLIVGTYPVELTASNGVQPDANLTFTLTVTSSGTTVPIITSGANVSGPQGTTFTYPVTATGNPAPTFSLFGAPVGVSIDSVTGIITISNTLALGTYSFTIVASNGNLPDATQDFTLTIKAPGGGDDDSDPVPVPPETRTLTDSATGVSVTGPMYDSTTLRVSKKDVLHAKGCRVCDLIRKLDKEGYLLVLYDIELVPPIGEDYGYTVTIPVGAQHNGKTLSILHCENGVPDWGRDTVTNGNVQIGVGGMSPFAVLKGEYEDLIKGDVPKTGDDFPMEILVVTFAALMAGAAYLFFKAPKSKSKRA